MISQVHKRAKSEIDRITEGIMQQMEKETDKTKV